MKSSLRHKDRHKHKIIIVQAYKPKAEQKAKQRKILVVLSSQVPEEKSCFVFVAFAYVARVNQALQWMSIHNIIQTRHNPLRLIQLS